MCTSILDSTRVMANSLETLTPELFTNILTFIDSNECTLNSLSKASRSLYRLTVPSLYHSFSHHGMKDNPERLRRFVDTLNWRPDLADHVMELDLRGWGKYALLEDHVGMMDGEQYKKRNEEKDAKKKEMMKGTIMDDKLLGDEGDDADCDDEMYDADNGSDDDEEDDFDVDGGEDGISEKELEFLGPAKPYDHSECVEGQCKNGIQECLKKEARGLGFEHQSVLVNQWMIWDEGSKEECKDTHENTLMILLLSQCRNVRTIYMAMPEVYWGWHYEQSSFCQFLEDTPALKASGILQNLETFYVCSPMYPGGKDHRQYELDLRRIFPFFRLPSMKSVHTLTAYIYWDTFPKSPVDFAPLKHTSNVTTLTYDECALAPFDVLQSLSMFGGLKSFRWTISPSCFASGSAFFGFQSDFGKALSAHIDTLEHLYFDNRFPFDKTHRQFPAPDMTDNNAIMIGSLREYSRMRTLAIDDTSLIGHQDWARTRSPLSDLLPPNLEELVLFVKVHQPPVPQDNSDIRKTTFDNKLFYPAFLTMLHSARTVLHKLQRIRIELTSDFWGHYDPVYIVVNEVEFAEAKALLVEAGIDLDIRAAVECSLDHIREVGYTDIPYFLDQVRGMNPGRDF